MPKPKMSVSDYKVGDLSSLLGFNDDAQSRSTLFDRPFESASVQRPSAPKLKKGPDGTEAERNDAKSAKKNFARKKKTNSDKSAKAEGFARENNDGDREGDGRKDAKDETSASSMITDGVDGVDDEIFSALMTEKTAAKTPAAESKNARKRRKRRENVLLEEREASAFEGEEPRKKRKKKDDVEEDSDEEKDEREKKKKKFVRDPADDDRTIFVGNIPKTIRKNQLVQLFSVFGKISKTRIRGAVSNDPKQSKKVAAITNNIHHKLDSLFAYIVFEKVESVAPAVDKMNGVEFQDRHLRVDVCKPGVSGTCNDKLSIFVGNLPYDVSEESLRQLFHDSCGDVSRVRCVRDSATRMGKGFGYVEFRSAGAVKEAVAKSEQLTLDGRQLRIKRAELYGKRNKQRDKFVGDAGKKRKKKSGGDGGGVSGSGKPLFEKGKKGMDGRKSFGRDKKKKTMVKL